VQSDIRLFVLRADQGENMLPPLRDAESRAERSPTQQELHEILSDLIEKGFSKEALRLARIYHRKLAPSSIVDFAASIQRQGQYDVSMRMAAQLTYDKNHNISREGLELLYPQAFFNLMSDFTASNDLPLSIFYGLVRQESYFAPAVISHAGAVGLSQLMPATMNEVARKIGYRNPDAKDPKTNLTIGSYYLRYLIDHRWTKNFAQALMAYNAGLGNIRKWKARFGSLNGLKFNNMIPILETRNYVQKVSAGAVYYSVLYGWNEPAAVLQTVYPDDFPAQIAEAVGKHK
ncbi:MAG: lytic transglycosylase domain-containing protein, partial [Spirochaetota bacterium]